MINEANGTPSHRDMTKIIARCLRKGGMTVATEHLLPNGKIADLAILTNWNTVHIIEVKTGLRPYLISTAWNKYAAYAHYLWVAAPESDPALSTKRADLVTWSQREDKIGLLAVDWTGPATVRSAQLLDHVPLCLDITRERILASLAAGEPAWCS